MTLVIVILLSTRLYRKEVPFLLGKERCDDAPHVERITSRDRNAAQVRHDRILEVALGKRSRHGQDESRKFGFLLQFSLRQCGDHEECLFHTKHRLYSVE